MTPQMYHLWYLKGLTYIHILQDRWQIKRKKGINEKSNMTNADASKMVCWVWQSCESYMLWPSQPPDLNPANGRFWSDVSNVLSTQNQGIPLMAANHLRHPIVYKNKLIHWWSNYNIAVNPFWVIQCCLACCCFLVREFLKPLKY